MCLLHVNQSKRTPEFYTFGKVKANSSISHTQVRVCEEELTLQEEGHKQHFDKKFDKALAAYDVLTNTTDSYLYAHTPAWSWSVSQETPMFPAHPSRTIEKFNTFAPRFNTSQICILPIGATILRSIDTCQITNFMTYFQVSRYSSIAVIWKKKEEKKKSTGAALPPSVTPKHVRGMLDVWEDAWLTESLLRSVMAVATVLATFPCHLISVFLFPYFPKRLWLLSNK